ncbi:MAG: glutathione S-transferase family protein [Cyanobacteria bacterium P01_H01_bin.15]
MSANTTAPLTWKELTALAQDYHADPTHGPTNSQARLRLFGQPESAVRVTLYRDNHAWCPYCQKVWLFLEEKQIPYRIEKVTMFCYGEKERWYKKRVPSGMLPALDLDGVLITESDVILQALEQTFGPFVWGMESAKVLPLRQLERSLFRAWCQWLCYRTWSQREENRHKDYFQETVERVEAALGRTEGPFFLEEFSIADLVFIPYVERMNASLFYYKGYSLREDNPGFKAWFDGLETRATYRGTQSDFHTHVHDLPPQMGGCWENKEPQTKENQKRVDQGPWLGLPDVAYPEPDSSKIEALARVLKHRANIIRVNPTQDLVFDEALRCALTYLMTDNLCTPPKDTDVGLRYLRDRINVPRDMSIYAAKRLRTALEETAALVGNRQGPAIPFNHRRDQDPAEFRAS